MCYCTKCVSKIDQTLFIYFLHLFSKSPEIPVKVRSPPCAHTHTHPPIQTHNRANAIRESAYKSTRNAYLVSQSQMTLTIPFDLCRLCPSSLPAQYLFNALWCHPSLLRVQRQCGST